MTRRGGRSRAEAPGFVSYRISAASDDWDRLLGALHELGTVGVEERPDSSPPMLLAYFAAPAPHAGLIELHDPPRGVRVSGPEPVPDEDWTAQWRQGLGPRRCGPLWIRPSWCSPCGSPEIVIDPERAFGSGEHATTRLALGLLLEQLRPGDRILDVGSGSGVLALGALRMGAGAAIGLDHDRVACRCALRNAGRNRLDLGVACATLDALDRRAAFDVVVANLLLAEMDPMLARLCAHARRRLVLSGYLEGQRDGVVERIRALGATVLGERSERSAGDPEAEPWGALVARPHRASRQ